MMLGSRWLGVASLIWLFVGAGIGYAIERLAPEYLREYFGLLWLFCGWVGPSFILALCGLQKGNLASRICAVLVLTVCALPLLLLVYAGIALRGH